jgi:hypothetical protein
MAEEGAWVSGGRSLNSRRASLAPTQQRRDPIAINRAAEIIALAKQAAEFAELAKLKFGFDALGDHADIKRFGHLQDCGHNRPIGVCLGLVHHETLVDLDPVER